MKCLDFARDDTLFCLCLPVYAEDVKCNSRKEMLVYVFLRFCVCVSLSVRDNNNLSQGEPSAWNINAAAARLLAAAAGYKDTSNAS